MSDWWARKLGGVIPQQSQQQAPPPQPVGYPQKAVRWQPSYPPTGPRQEVETSQPEGNGDDTYQRVRGQGYDHKAPSGLGKDGRCPDCGGSNFFRRRWANAEAAPLCTDCGYNGDLFTQSGTLLNAVGMKSSGPVAFARTDNPGADSRFGADPGLENTDFSWANVR